MRKASAEDLLIYCDFKTWGDALLQSNAFRFMSHEAEEGKTYIICFNSLTMYMVISNNTMYTTDHIHITHSLPRLNLAQMNISSIAIPDNKNR